MYIILLIIISVSHYLHKLGSALSRLSQALSRTARLIQSALLPHLQSPTIKRFWAEFIDKVAFVSPSSISFNVFAARLPVCALWLFFDKTELFGREFCDRGQNIVLRVIFSSGGLVATSGNRTLSKPDPQQTLPLPPA